MKKNFLSMFALAALFLAGCSSEDVTPSGEVNGANGEVETHYMAVNLMSAETRATGDYELGSASENQVDKVRFYFFDENGDAANVKLSGTNYVNYYDWTPGSATMGNKGDNVEKTLDATIVINTANGDKLPQQIVAVLNPTTALDNDAKDLSELQVVFANYANSTLTTAGKFVMFNSVFRQNGAEYCAVPITAENLQKSETDAKNNPVHIYVERSVAKVQVATDKKVGFDDEQKLALKDKEGNAILVDGQQVYLKLNGWSLTAETSNGRLVKKINPAWTSSWWNKSLQFRSIWAINSPTAVNNYYNYNAINGSFDNAKYTNENAAKLTKENGATVDTPAANHTKVILSGTLVKEDGTPFTIVRHLGAYLADTFDGEDESKNLLALKKSILNYFAAGGNNYYYDSDEIVNEKPVRKQIDIDDVKIVYAAQLATEGSKNNCYVYAQLTDAAAGKTWYTSLAEDAEPLANAATTINNALKDKKKVDWALVWNGGMTYYYYEIEHNKEVKTDDEGKTNTSITYGVVRNHIYKTTITSIAGLGTPVYNPLLTIYPEKPEPNDHYIAADINILSWRIVETGYDLEW